MNKTIINIYNLQILFYNISPEGTKYLDNIIK